MRAFSPGKGINRNEDPPITDSQYVYKLGEADILSNITTELWVAVTDSKRTESDIHPITEAEEPYWFVLNQKRTIMATDRFGKTQQQVALIPQEYLTDQPELSDMDKLRVESNTKDRYCFGCSYITSKVYSISNYEYFIEY
jgi:hypothetical protein